MPPINYKATAPTYRPAFTSVMPYEQIFSPALLDQLAASQIDPEIARERAYTQGQQMRNMAQTGGYRTGMGQFERQRLSDAYARQAAEQKAAFKGQVEDWTNNWYNQQMVNYGTNPMADVMPTLNTFKAQQYTQARGSQPFGGRSLADVYASQPTGVSNFTRRRAI